MTQRDLCGITKAKKSQRSQLRHSTELWYNKLMIREGQNLTLNPQYLAGFVDGEGCFSITINSRKQPRKGLYVRLLFEIELREDDKEILEKIQKTLGCGYIYRLDYQKYKKWIPHCKLKVSNFADIYSKIIPFFRKYPLQGKKKENFKVFCEVAGLIKQRRHLTKEEIEKIRKIRESVKNKKRINV